MSELKSITQRCGADSLSSPGNNLLRRNGNNLLRRNGNNLLIRNGNNRWISPAKYRRSCVTSFLVFFVAISLEVWPRAGIEMVLLRGRGYYCVYHCTVLIHRLIQARKPSIPPGDRLPNFTPNVTFVWGTIQDANRCETFFCPSCNVKY